MNREAFLKLIPKPSNEDVILYDTSLKDLIDIDVPNEYAKLLPVFKEEKKDFLKLKKEIDTYTETINNVFLLNPSWSEEIYLQKLQEDMRTYSNLYGNIKKKEDKIKIYQKKVQSINEKIIIQKNREEKDNEIRNASINEEIENNKINLKKFKDNTEIYKNSSKNIKQQIEETKLDLKMLNLSETQLAEGTYKCFCCGKKIKPNEAEKVINKIKNKIQENQIKLDSLLEEQDKIKDILNYYKDEILKNKIQLQNNLNFKRNYKNIYVKKSIEVLKLEALKNEYLNKITELNENLKNEPYINSKKFLELKNRIEKYKISLENLKKVKNIKATMQSKINTYKEKQIQIKEKETLIYKYLSFLNIYYKIYEKKASEFAGENYKIKFFQIVNFEILEVLIITYKGTEYSQLPRKEKEIVDKNLTKKFFSDF